MNKIKRLENELKELLIAKFRQSEPYEAAMKIIGKLGNADIQELLIILIETSYTKGAYDLLSILSGKLASSPKEDLHALFNIITEIRNERD